MSGALTLADVQRAPLPTVAASRARLPLAQEGERRVARMTPHPPSSGALNVVVVVGVLNHPSHGDGQEMS